MDKPSFRDIFSLHIKYIEYLLEKTKLSHSYTRNIQQSGAEIESNVRELLSAILPKRFQVTHGYIISAQNQSDEPLISPQVDVIIVDTLVSHSIFNIDKSSGLEIVPTESVVGIVEIKRTLNKSALLGSNNKKGALQQIKDIIDSVGIEKYSNDCFLPGGHRIGRGILGGHRANPLIGILSVDHVQTLYHRRPNSNIGSIFSQYKRSNGDLPIDFIASLNGLMYVLTNENGNMVLGNPMRNDLEHCLADPRVNSSAAMIAKILGYISAYITTCSGRQMEPQNYFFNRNL